MKVIFFNTKSYDRDYFAQANQQFDHELVFLEPRLNQDTWKLARGAVCICVFVNDGLDSAVLTELASHGLKLIALRCAGYNNVDLAAAHQLGVKVVRVPNYSPSAVAEHTIGLMLSLNRKIHRAYDRVREGNFSLEGLLGYNFNGLTAGIVGTGRIGIVVARILNAIGMRVLGCDPVIHPEAAVAGIEYTDLNDLLTRADVISLHCPLTTETRHIIDQAAIERLRAGVMLINTGRGALIDTKAVIAGLKAKKIGLLGLDVYEQEDDLFFEDLSSEIIQDDVFQRLLTFPNVLVTSHQGFFTANALKNIADTTLNNIREYEQGKPLSNQILLQALS